MTNESRDQILIDFQDCTGLENMDECIHILEQHEWELLNAVQAVHDRFESGTNNQSTVPSQHAMNNISSSETKTTNQNISNNKRQSESNDLDDSDEPRIVKTVAGSQRMPIGTSSTASKGSGRDLQFTIEYLDETERIIIPDNESVHELRLKISDKLHISPNKQNFLSWMTKSYDDRTILRDLNLPKENKIRLTSIENGRTHNHTTQSTIDIESSSNGNFPVTVLCEDKLGKSTTYNLSFKPNSTINEIKNKIEQLTNIPIKEQTWYDLLGAKDSDELRQTSISRRAHIRVRQLDTSLNQQTVINRRDITHSIISTDRSEDEQMDIDHDIALEQYEDDDITVISPNISTTTIASGEIPSREPLIPDDCTDDASGLEHFSRVFHTRYGVTGPILYIGPLDQAIQDSLHLSIDNRRPLAIYLHKDQSVCANVFCSQVLAAESIVEFLATNFVVWAWDITSDANRTRLLDTLRRCVGNQCAQRVSSTDNDSFPLLLIIIRSRGSLELINVIEGKSTPDEVFHNLVQSYESFDQQRERDTEEEVMRETRENLKREQEDEYDRSLAADLAKQRARQDDERKLKEEENANERLKQQRLEKQRECQARLTKEPSETEKDITRLKIRLPDDDGVLMRRFRIDDTLQMLFDYLTSQGRMFGEYKLLTTFPKRDLSTLSGSDTFKQLKLFPQEQLILESL